MKQRLTPRGEARSGLLLLVVMVAAMWVIEAINSLDSGRLAYDGGILPRNVDHLWAIFTSPFLHANFVPHLLDNTIPLLFMGVIIAIHGARRLGFVTLVVIVVAGLGTWLISPSHTDTYGASGLVFGYATYLFARGIFDRSPLELIVGLVVGVIWGAVLVSSIVPHAHVSWQDHASGAVGGVIAAWLLAAPRSRRRDATHQSGSGGSGTVARSGSAPLGGHDLHDALDRALES